VTVLLGWLNKTEKILRQFMHTFRDMDFSDLWTIPGLKGFFCHLSALLYCLYQCCKQSALVQFLDVEILLPIAQKVDKKQEPWDLASSRSNCYLILNFKTKHISA